MLYNMYIYIIYNIYNIIYIYYIYIFIIIIYNIEICSTCRLGWVWRLFCFFACLGPLYLGVFVARWIQPKSSQDIRDTVEGPAKSCTSDRW